MVRWSCCSHPVFHLPLGLVLFLTIDPLFGRSPFMACHYGQHSALTGHLLSRLGEYQVAVSLSVFSMRARRRI